MDAPLRVARLADTEILLGLIRTYYSHDDIPFNEATIRAGLDQLLLDQSLGRVWLIEHEGQDVGYVILTFAFDLEFGGREAFITDLYIAPNYCQKGLGRRTLEAIEGFCRELGLRTIELQVECNNPQAQSFYHKSGFQSHDRIPMSKDLSR